MIRTSKATDYTEEAMDAGVVRHTVDEIHALPEGQRAGLSMASSMTWLRRSASTRNS